MLFLLPSLRPSVPAFSSPSASLFLASSHSRATVSLCHFSSPMSSNEASNPNGENGAIEENQNLNSDVLVQYVVLRRDLIDSWPLGSVVTQGCHASVAAIWEHKDDSHTADYCGERNLDHMHKVTLEVKGETQIINLVEKLKVGGISHKLWIEQPENIPTCIATKPYPKSVVSAFFRKLKLCK